MSESRQSTTPWGVRLTHVMDVTDFEACYAAVSSRDRRFDGRFVTGVLTTGIFCRPSCPARTPNRPNVRFFPTPAAARDSGLRACRRCRPELAPDRPGWDPAADLAGKALRLIEAGGGEDGVDALARRLHVSARHLQRIVTDAYGAGPAALIAMRRVRLARMLVDQTDLPLTRVAFAAGFGSVRQFNAAFKATFHATPSDVRRGRAATGATTVHLPARQPFDGRWVLEWTAGRTVPGLLEVDGDALVRHTDAGELRMRPDPDGVGISIDLDAEHLDLRPAVALVRQAFDTDADAEAIHAALAADPLLGPLVQARPGLRIPGHVDPWEGAVRTILGQQVSAKAATTFMGRLSALDPDRRFPDPSLVRDADLQADVGLTRQRATAVRALAAAIDDGLDLSAAADPDDVTAALVALPGIGPWTAAVICLFSLRHPDAWPTGDLALRRAVGNLTGDTPTSAELDRLAQRWRPWRGYAAMYLWHHDHVKDPS